MTMYMYFQTRCSVGITILRKAVEMVNFALTNTKRKNHHKFHCVEITSM